MAKIKREIKIDSTVEKVWNKVTDFENMPRWFYGVKRVILLSDYLGTGAERLVTITTGQSYRERITEWDEEKSFSYMVLDPITFITEWRANISLTPTVNSVVVEWEICYKTKYGILGKIADAILIAHVIDKELLFSLKKFKKTTEA